MRTTYGTRNAIPMPTNEGENPAGLAGFSRRTAKMADTPTESRQPVVRTLLRASARHLRLVKRPAVLDIAAIVPPRLRTSVP